MPQPIEFEFTAQQPVEVAAFLAAYAGSVARICAPVVGETVLRGPRDEELSRILHFRTLEQCYGAKLPEESLLTPQLTRFDGESIVGRLCDALGAGGWTEASSATFATLPAPFTPFRVERRVFRHLTSGSAFGHLAYSRVDVGPYSADVSISLPPWLVTSGLAYCGFTIDGVSRLLHSLFDAFVDLKKRCPGSSRHFRMAIPGGSLIPELDHLLTILKEEAPKS